MYSTDFFALISSHPSDNQYRIERLYSVFHVSSMHTRKGHREVIGCGFFLFRWMVVGHSNNSFIRIDNWNCLLLNFIYSNAVCILYFDEISRVQTYKTSHTHIPPPPTFRRNSKKKCNKIYHNSNAHTKKANMKRSSRYKYIYFINGFGSIWFASTCQWNYFVHAPTQQELNMFVCMYILYEEKRKRREKKLPCARNHDG